MSSLAVGFVGAGNRAQAHYRSIDAHPDAHVAAVCDIDADARERTATRYGVPDAYAAYEELLARDDLDAVYVVMGPELLDPIVTDALSAGQHVFIEKPPGMSAAQTSRWADLAERNACLTCVGFQRRFNPFAVAARERIEETSEVGYAVATFHKHAPDWSTQLHDDVIHVIDFLSWAGGGIDGVDGYHGQLFADPQDYDQFGANAFVAVLELANGGVGILNANRVAGGRTLGFELHAEAVSAIGSIQGSADVDELRIQAEGTPYAEAERIVATELVPDDLPATAIDGTYQLNDHFLTCVANGREPDVTFADTIASMRAMEAIQHGTRFPTTFSD